GRLGDLRVLVQALVPGRGLGRAVDVPVAQPQKPRLALVAVLALDVLDSPFGVVVRRVAVLPLLLAVESQQLLLVVGPGVVRVFGPVPDDLVVPIAAEPRVRAGVPLADLGGVVAVRPELRRPERTLLRVVGAAGVLPLRPHRLDAVRVVPGED